MIVLWGLMGLLNLCAGVGVKWLVDRLLGPQVVVAPAGHRGGPDRGPERGPERAAAMRVLEFDDTMDVLGAGYAAGQEQAWAAARRPPVRIRPRLDPVPPEEYLPARPPAPAAGERVFRDTGGWISGPCLDQPPAPGGDR